MRPVKFLRAVASELCQEAHPTEKICGNAKNPLAAAAWRGKVWTPLAILMEQRASQHLGDMRVDGNITSGISRTAAAVFVLLQVSRPRLFLTVYWAQLQQVQASWTFTISRTIASENH